MGRTGLSSPTIWRLERTGQFPARVQLAPNSVGWFESDVEAWLVSRQRVTPPTTKDLSVAEEMQRLPPF